MGIVFWIGIIAGFLIMRHFAAPLFKGEAIQDINKIYSNLPPQQKQKVQSQTSPADLQKLRAQGINI